MTTQDPPTSCKVVLAGSIAKSLQLEVREGLSKLDRKPMLVGFLANKDPAARLYADWTNGTCEENGFQFSLREVDREELEEQILAANKDETVDGVIVYYPIFNSRQDQYLQQLIDAGKDVEGLCHQYVFNMYQNIRFVDEQKLRKSILPCTPLAIVKILEYLKVYNTILPYGNRLFGHSITIVNRSEVVGRPLAALLANDGACVYSVDATSVQQFTRGEGIRKTRHDVIEKIGWNLEDCVPLSDVVISGVPGQAFEFPTHLLKEGAVCINFSTEKNFGPEVKNRASIYVPAIGKVTIIVLLRNLLRNATTNPKNAQSKRELAKREPLAHENTKVVLSLRGTTCSALVQDIISDINALKRPFTIRFTKKNDIHPFEDSSSLEFFSQKNDASLLLFGSHSKKRPHCLTWIRCFSGQVLDMLEVYVIKDTARTLAQFNGEKCKVGQKPLLSFSGAQFESPVANQYTLAKSIFTDFFRGGESATVDVEGLQLMINFAAGEDALDGSPPKIHMRCWRIVTKRSGQKVPRVEVEEMGPRIDFTIGRTREAEASVWKESMKKAKGVEAKSKKNIETDLVGDKIGRIHLGKQDLSELQTRKMKGLKREREVEVDEGADDISIASEDHADIGKGVELKRQRVA
ncbi:MAG: hypothetical protein Q9182_006353 [Xanthomendoza sp. 2 TL-2023]